jgi:hypothetical protein
MKPLSCTAARRRLSAYHDGELPVREQIAVRAHLERCAACAGDVAHFGALGDLVRAAAAAVVSDDTLSGIRIGVLGRLNAEREQSVTARVGRMFEDLHLAWAALGATVATLACVTVMSGLLRFASLPQRTDSMAAVLSALGSPGSNANPIPPDRRVIMPRVYPQALMPVMLVHREPSSHDGFVSLSAIVTREGTLNNVSVVSSDADDDQALAGMVSAAMLTRFEPGQLAGSPVAVNLVWVLSHTTVKGKI